jgi:hypothetical protein
MYLFSQRKLTTPQIFLLDERPVVNLKKETILIYKGHIPIVSYYIVEGEVEFYDKEKNKIIMNECPTIIGSYENFNNIPYEFYVVAKTDLKIKVIDRSLLNKIFNKKRKRINHK